VIQGKHKLVHYLGYKHYRDEYEFFNLESDPGELENQYNPTNPVIMELQAEMENQVIEADRQYRAR
jgi:hypothetical protein